MPVAKPPMYPYGDTGILWLDALLKGMHKDPFSIMPGAGPAAVLGGGEEAAYWRAMVQLMTAMSDRHLPGLDDAYRTALSKLSNAFPKEMPQGGTANTLSAMLGGRGGDSLHTLVPSALSEQDALAQQLVGLMTNRYNSPTGLSYNLEQMLRPPKPR